MSIEKLMQEYESAKQLVGELYNIEGKSNEYCNAILIASELKKAINQYKMKIEYHTYYNIDNAENNIKKLILEIVEEECDTLDNCGDDYYYIDFIVDNVIYKGVVIVTYDHIKNIKQYGNKLQYYIKSVEFFYNIKK